MYNRFFGFRENPFKLNPDPRFFYAKLRRHRVFDELASALNGQAGFHVLIGEAGSGKSILLQTLKLTFNHSYRTVYFGYSSLGFEDFLYLTCEELGVTHDKGHAQQGLEKLFRVYAQAGKTLVLFIDEAQTIPSDSMLQLLRWYGEIVGRGYSFQLVFAGQAELEARLASLASFPNLMPHLICKLEPVRDDEVAGFIHHRLALSGVPDDELFTPKALQLIGRHAQGIPRLINLICSKALVLAHVASKTTVGEEVITTVIQDLGLQAEARNGGGEQILLPEASEASVFGLRKEACDYLGKDSETSKFSFLTRGRREQHNEQSKRPRFTHRPVVFSIAKKIFSRLPSVRRSSVLVAAAGIVMAGVLVAIMSRSWMQSGASYRIPDSVVTSEIGGRGLGVSPHVDTQTPERREHDQGSSEFVSSGKAQKVQSRRKPELAKDIGMPVSVAPARRGLIVNLRNKVESPPQQHTDTVTMSVTPSSQMPAKTASRAVQNKTAEKTNAKVAHLLERASYLVERKLFTTPAHKNALSLYREVLQLSPNNKVARKAIEQMKQQYLDWATQAEKREDWINAHAYYTRALIIVPNDKRLLAARKRVTTNLKRHSKVRSRPENSETIPLDLEKQLELSSIGKAMGEPRDIEAKSPQLLLTSGDRPRDR